MIESLDEITNPDDKSTGIENTEISETNTICIKGFFEGFKILICAFWSCKLSKNESEQVNPKYLLERYTKEKKCLKEVLDYYLIKMEMREDYKECIEELQTGNYYVAWIINSDGGGKLPNNGNENLVGPFIDALIHYWKNGGSLCFWCENDPFSCECNFFLEIGKFP